MAKYRAICLEYWSMISESIVSMWLYFTCTIEGYSYFEMSCVELVNFQLLQLHV